MEGVASNIVNVNMGSGEGSRGFRRAYSEKILPALEDFGPGLIVISAGERARILSMAVKPKSLGHACLHSCTRDEILGGDDAKKESDHFKSFTWTSIFQLTRRLKVQQTTRNPPGYHVTRHHVLPRA